MFPRRAFSLEAKLKGVDGFTGTGVVRASGWTAGYLTFEIELKGVGGQRAALHARGLLIAPIPLSDGKGSAQFDSRRDAIDLAFAAEEPIEIHQNGHAILRGILVDAGRTATRNRSS